MLVIELSCPSTHIWIIYEMSLGNFLLLFIWFFLKLFIGLPKDKNIRIHVMGTLHIRIRLAYRFKAHDIWPNPLPHCKILRSYPPQRCRSPSIHPCVKPFGQQQNSLNSIFIAASDVHGFSICYKSFFCYCHYAKWRRQQDFDFDEI